jgi:hypothetical protein
MSTIEQEPNPHLSRKEVLKSLFFDILENGTLALREYKKARNFAELREIVVAQCSILTELRQLVFPQYTAEEKKLECYLQELEPQVREAVRILNQKGYHTTNSGFMWHLNVLLGISEPSNEELEYQYIEGHFKLDPQTIAQLSAIGVEVIYKRRELESWMVKARDMAKQEETFYKEEFDPLDLITIRFKPEEVNLVKIKEKWDEIATLLPPVQMSKKVESI